MTAARLLVRGGTVVTMDAARRVVQGDVLIEGGRIAAVGAVDAAAAGGAAVVDAAGAIVMPGLVQAHVHLCQTLFRGRADDLPLLDWLRRRIWPYEAALDEESLASAARLGCLELIRGGTTSILDMGTVHHQDVLFEVLRASGLRAVAGKAMMDTGEGVPAGLREQTAGSLAEAERLCARWDGAEGGRLRYAFAPRFVLSCTEELLRGVVDAARRRGAGIHTHASEQQAELEVVRAERGADNVAYLHGLGMSGPRVALAHCVWATDDEIALLSRTGTHVVHCPSSNLKLASGIARVPELLARGVNVALGADGAPCNNDLDGFLELRLAALLHKPRAGAAALPAAQALELATLGGARALGLGAEIGSLEPGKRADVVVVDVERAHVVPTDDPYAALVYACRAADVRTVIVDGRLVLRDRELLTLDEGAILAEARRHARRIAAALGA